MTVPSRRRTVDECVQEESCENVMQLELILFFEGLGDWKTGPCFTIPAARKVKYDRVFSRLLLMLLIG